MGRAVIAHVDRLTVLMGKDRSKLYWEEYRGSDQSREVFVLETISIPKCLVLMRQDTYNLKQIALAILNQTWGLEFRALIRSV